MQNICNEFSPELVVIVDDGKPFVSIATVIAEAHGLKVRRLAPNVNSSKEQYKIQNFVRKHIVEILKKSYKIIHASRNALNIILLAKFAPGFKHKKELRCVLFDPYVGYEWLMPQLFGCSYEHVMIPCPNFQLMPRIQYYQNIFGVSTSYFHVPNSPLDKIAVKRLQELLAVTVDKLPLPTHLPGLEAVWLKLTHSLAEYAGALIPKVCADISAAQSLIRKYNIDTIVLPYDEFWFYKALALVGKREGISTIAYQHGMVNHYSVLIPPTSERILVWDRNAHDCFRSWGVSDRKISMLPNPMRVLLQEKSTRINKEMVRGKLGLKKDCPVVLFAAQQFAGLSSMDNKFLVVETLKKILSLCELIPEILFLIKLHPDDAYTAKSKMVNDLIEVGRLSNVKVITSWDSHELIIASDAVIAETSTCLWEATILGRFAVSFINREFTRQIVPYNSDSGVIRADNIEELVKVIREFIGQNLITENHQINERKF